MAEITDRLREEEKDYNEELEASLRRAFTDKRADFIIFDGHTVRNKFLTDSINHGLKQGWLYNAENIDEDKVLGQGRGQYTALTYRLTDEGKRYFGIE